MTKDKIKSKYFYISSEIVEDICSCSSSINLLSRTLLLGHNYLSATCYKVFYFVSIYMITEMAWHVTKRGSSFWSWQQETGPCFRSLVQFP